MSLALNNWLLTIECDSLEDQEKRNPEYAFPRDEISRIVENLMSRWGGLPEEFLEDAEWDASTIRVTFEILDHIAEFMEWLMMHIVPKSVKLKRIKD
jgi:hypothetical protein